MIDLAEIQTVVEQLYQCSAEHVATIPVFEKLQGETVWGGEVEVFRLLGHLQADRCYAWPYVDDNGIEQLSTVLNLPPVNSAKTAVRAAIIAKAKSAK